jgi:hypothetical protein
MRNPAIDELREQSTWRLLALSIVTYGIYTAYYCKRQARTMNRHLAVDRQIPEGLGNTVVALNWLSLALFMPYVMDYRHHQIEEVSDFVDLVAVVSFVVWGFVARGRANLIFEAQRGDGRWFHGFWTLLFSPLYFNFKVNTQTLRDGA